ncbi:diguanylate cyclase [Enterovibrio sp. ZSDZ35]|uniref:diguanylate cyclase n=1 Tax=Enterovibrio qingdaonensis TaxID=2899818 RepID=A0ABT5QRM7_9GAMM|nr:diguanylate cyclase [Enterovibrio sp. ZSDZ35]MDD1783637.1 diguanylate cyclase [Enterovibrio sp. ZSDZ35]
MDSIGGLMVLMKYRYARFFALLIGISISVLMAWIVADTERKTISVEFQNDIDQRAASLSKSLFTNFEALHSLATLFRSNPHTAYSEFQLEARRTLKRHRDIQALEWIPFVKKEEREHFENAFQREFPGFKFTELSPEGEMIEAGVREEYFPVYFVEPYIGNEKALGFDLFASPSRAATINKVRDSGFPASTSSITLVQETANEKGFLAIVPIFKGSISTLADRRNNLIGVVLGVFRIRDIFIASQHGELPAEIVVEIYDITDDEKGDELYKYVPAKGKHPVSEMAYQPNNLNVLGRMWQLRATATNEYVQSKKTLLPLVILFAGIAITLVFTAYMRLVFKHAELVEREVIDRTKELDEANHSLRQLTQKDTLTGLFNRRYYDAQIEQEWARAQRNHSRISLLIFDVDHFKEFNDQYGHLAGDECLTKIGQTLKMTLLRSQDTLCRYGGEEFVAILPDTNDPLNVAEKCRKRIEELGLEHSISSHFIVTITVGCAQMVPTPNLTSDDLFNAADEALYQAKQDGRNRVHFEVNGQLHSVDDHQSDKKSS